MQVGNKQTTNDLAQTLQSESGTFYAQIGGLSFLVICAEGHSIKSIRPIGRAIIPATTNPNESWDVEKLSNSQVELQQGQYQSHQQQQGREPRQ